MQECGNAFIGQLATELVMRAEKDHVKTIGEKQVFGALEALGFDDMKAEVERVGVGMGDDSVESEGSRIPVCNHVMDR